MLERRPYCSMACGAVSLRQNVLEKCDPRVGLVASSNSRFRPASDRGDEGTEKNQGSVKSLDPQLSRWALVSSIGWLL